MANGSSLDEGVPDEQIPLCVWVGGCPIYFECVKRVCLQLNTLKWIWWDCVREVALFSVVLLPFLPFICTNCVTLPPYRWWVSMGNRPLPSQRIRPDGIVVITQRLDIRHQKSVGVCVLAALLPACLFCHLVCELHATDDFCTLIWRLISLVQSECICHCSVISMIMHIQALYEPLGRKVYLLKQQKHFIVLYVLHFPHLPQEVLWIHVEYNILRSSIHVLVLWWGKAAQLKHWFPKTYGLKWNFSTHLCSC